MSWKDYKSVSAAQKAGSMYFMGKDGEKKLAVTKEQLDSWKSRNEGKFKGSALTAYANAKGKDIGGDKPPSAPPARPTAKREERGQGPSTRSPEGAAEIRAARAAARKAASEAQKVLPSTKGGTSDRLAKGGGYAEDISPSEEVKAANLAANIRKLLDEETPDDPKTYFDNLQRFTRNLRSILDKGGLSERPDKFRGLRADGPLFGGRSGMAKGGMAKKGYAKGGMIKANCGASMKPNRKAKK